MSMKLAIWFCCWFFPFTDLIHLRVGAVAQREEDGVYFLLVRSCLLSGHLLRRSGKLTSHIWRCWTRGRTHHHRWLDGGFITDVHARFSFQPFFVFEHRFLITIYNNINVLIMCWYIIMIYYISLKNRKFSGNIIFFQFEVIWEKILSWKFVPKREFSENITHKKIILKKKLFFYFCRFF